MDPGEYDLKFFHDARFHRRTCRGCGHAFWTLGDSDRCAEAPCTPYSFIGNPGFARTYSLSEMRETYLRFFEARGHQRVRRYPIVARWRNDVFFVQASIYDFQPWVTSGEIPPPANPLTISQPCLRLNDLDQVGHSGRHLTLFEMAAHHAFNRPDHEVYFKERCVALCHELLTETLGAPAPEITYKEEVWEGGGNLGPSLSVGLRGMELATLVFMEYVREGEALKPMPLTVVDTGYGIERFVWVSHGTRSAYEPVFGEPYQELRRTFRPEESAILVDHARALNFLVTDGVIPSNVQEGYYARLLLRRMLRLLDRTPEAPALVAILDRVGRELAHDFPEIGAHREDFGRVIEAEVERFRESVRRGRGQVRRLEERIEKEGGAVTGDDLVSWYDSLGIPPEVAVDELRHPPTIPEDFDARLARRHPDQGTASEVAPSSVPVPPSDVPATEVGYYLDPYTVSFWAHCLWTQGPWVVLDRTYFYPTGGGQITDTGKLGEVPVVDVLRKGLHVLHRLDRDAMLQVGEEVHGHIDEARRRQLMQHHTATHLLNGALREILGPHVWQAGAYKGVDEARIDITHYRALSEAEVRNAERRVNRVIRENRPVRSYFEKRTEAERRFGFTLYQGGMVPGGELRIVEIENFDVEACGGTHCTRTGEVGLVSILGSERIQDGVVRLSYAAGERALELKEVHDQVLREAARLLSLPIAKVPQGIEKLQAELAIAHKAERRGKAADFQAEAERLLADPALTESIGGVMITAAALEAVPAEGLKEIARLITRTPGRVALLTSSGEGRGFTFIGSSSPRLPAQEILAAMQPAFAAKGGGNASAATAVGEPGPPLIRALEAGRARAIELAHAGDSSPSTGQSRRPSA